MLRDPFLAEHQPMAGHSSTPRSFGFGRAFLILALGAGLHCGKADAAPTTTAENTNAKPTAGKTAPGKPRGEAKTKENAPAPAERKPQPHVAPSHAAAVPCRAARAKKRCRACPGRAAAESPLAGSSAARHFLAAAKIAARLARENARLRGRMDETQVGGARSAALMARLRGGMSNPSKTRLKSIKDTRDTRKRSRVTLVSRCLAAWRERSLGSLARARSN